MRTPKLGQHFLTRPETAEWVIDAINPETGSTVLEIGPGHGMLTRALLKRGLTVVALEKDASLVHELTDTFSGELSSGQLTLLHGDVRDFVPTDVPVLASGYALIANIPYYITGQIIRSFLTTEHQPQAMSLLMQKEVAERIVARDGKQSVLSLSVHLYGTPTLYKTVKAGAFSPPPSVDSAILAITNIKRSDFTPHIERVFFDIVKTAFSQKRKMLGSTLKQVVREDCFLLCGVTRDARPEDVRLKQWLCLARNSV
jgi:16S rRNA (adenine1518-N6/adenine1519-N6)-dimethyltransferase